MNVQSDIKAGEWNPPLPKKKSNLESLGKAIQTLQSVYFDLEHGAETQETPKPPTPEEMDKILSDTYDKIEAGLYAITPLPDLSLEGIKDSYTHSVWVTPKQEESWAQKYLKENPPMHFDMPRRKNFNEIPKLGFTFKEASEKLAESLKQTSKNLNSLKMEKKIIGYKLKDKKYKKFADKLVNTELIGDDSNKMDFNLNGMWFIKFREAGVLDLWFEPVYESQTLEVGKWYMDTDGDIFFIEKWEESFTDSGYGYGFCRGDWTVRENGSNYAFRKGFRPATDKEVEEALIKEAKKRGYKDGVETEHGKISREKFGGGYYEHELEDSGSFFFYNIEVFKDGQWAEIISTTTLPEIGGYQGENKNNYLKYGCTEVPKSLIQGMSDLGITSFNLKVDGKKIKVSKSQTKQLFEYINKE